MKKFAAAIISFSLLGVLAGLLFQASPVSAGIFTIGLNYGPFRDGQRPGGPCPTDAQIREDLHIIKALSFGPRTIRTYGVRDCSLWRIARIASEPDLRLKVVLGAWIDTNRAENDRELTQLIQTANDYPDTVKAVLVGSETIRFGRVTLDELLAYIKRVKAAVPQPVSAGEIWEDWLGTPSLAEAVDFIFAHIHPYWDAVCAQNAGADTLGKAVRLRNAYPEKKVVIGETGWPTDGDNNGCADPSLPNQTRYLRDLYRLSKQNDFPLFIFEMFDENWKTGEPNGVGPHWGIYYSNRTSKR